MALSPLCWPELIRASDWLPVARHEDSTEQQPVFETLDHTRWVLGLAMVHYGNVAPTVLERPGRYGSLSSADCSSATSSVSFGSRRSRRPSRYAWHPETTPRRRRQNGSVISGVLMLADMARKARESEEPRCSNPCPRQDRGVSHQLIEWRLANLPTTQRVDPKIAASARNGRPQ